MAEGEKQLGQEMNGFPSSGADFSASVSPSLDSALLAEGVKAGVVVGLRHSKTNPKMSPFIAMTRSGVEVIDFHKTMESLDRATAFIKDTVRSRGAILVVGTTPPAREAVKAFAEQLHFPYVYTRWLGGTLTNFSTIRSRVQHYVKLKADRAAGRLEKYTKKERGQFDKEIERLEEMFSGLEFLQELPKALLVIDVAHHAIAVREAGRMGIPVVALMNTDGNPESVQYPIPGNDRGRTSIQWVLGKLAAAAALGAAEAVALPIPAKKPGGIENA